MWDSRWVNAKRTDTKGKYPYLVCSLCKGVEGDSNNYWGNYQIINADCVREAERKYNELNSGTFYCNVIL